MATTAVRAEALYRVLFEADFGERNQGKLFLLDPDTHEHGLAATQRQMTDLSRDLPPAPHRFLLRHSSPLRTNFV